MKHGVEIHPLEVNFTGTQFSYTLPDINTENYINIIYYYGYYYALQSASWAGGEGSDVVYAPDSDNDGANDLIDSDIYDPSIQ